MLKRSLYLGFFLLLAVKLPAQVNLVQNESFEDTLQCPFSNNQITFAPPWQPTYSSPDYFHSCTSNNGIHVPSNAIGYQFPRTGNAYAGFYTYLSSMLALKEYIQEPLLTSLVNGQTYKVEFYVSLGDSCSVATHNMGMFFSDTAITTTTAGAVIDAVPQITNTLSSPLTDKTGWTKVSGNFVADGTELYITIGNFLEDPDSDTTHVGGGSYPYSYYYIDDISVTCLNCPEAEVELVIPTFLSGNDFFEIQSLPYNSSLYLYNSLGQIVFKTDYYNNTLSARNFRTGVYYYSLLLNNGKVYKGKLCIAR